MKVLIISHNPISTYNAMGKTFASLFSQFNRKELCQLYIYPSYPDIHYCSSYYRVTDKEIVQFYLRWKLPGSEVKQNHINAQQSIFENEKDEAVYRNSKNKSPMRRLLRDLLWKGSRWYNQSLKEWLDKEKPSCIFVAPGAAKLLYDIAIRISKERGIPYVVYLCDEYYFVEEKKNPIEKIQYILLKRKIENLLKNASFLVTISDEARKCYQEKFGIPVNAVMTGSSFQVKDYVSERKNPEAICFFGNIRCGRYRSLIDIGKALDEINDEIGTSYEMRIYTAEKDAYILNQLLKYKCVKLLGFLKGEEFYKKFHNADILLHVEDFSYKSISYTKHSISTKIADCLASGIPFVAYGPNEISSIQHLINNNCAIVITEKENLKKELRRIFCDKKYRLGYVKNAIETAKKYHDSEKNSEKLYNIIRQIQFNE